ncbi:AAA family ATPase [Candidatus Viridilinea mediisalina]|uniref:AAA family ATPase n=1 Tax=Candidatus Viridilinea mediisalina TaxID=2024553 RepID=UPI0013FDAC42|nr:ATP-binding protein [Candidatus Viridilinea mediisalina]
MRTYLDSTSRANKQGALLRATDALTRLGQAVAERVVAPDSHLLRRIVRQWQALLIAEGGVVGRALQVGPVDNPYILNNPAEGSRFVGREDVLRRLEELWSPQGVVPSVLLYGHRRMGKTSILRNLGQRFGQQTLIVDFNLQMVGSVRDEADLLFQLAIAIYDACAGQGLAGLAEPREADFTSDHAYMAFRRFLRRLEGLRAGRRLIVTLDEFELLEQQLAAELPRLLRFWRGAFQTFPWLVLAFAGLHTLEERRRDYWDPLFGSVTAIKVSFLARGAARRLIVEPTPDFDLDYDEDVVTTMLDLTNGQPFLVNLLGHALVSRFNQRSFEEGREQERRFHMADLEAVLAAPNFFRDGDAYFSGIWHQAQHSAPAGQPAILSALAPHAAGLTRAQLAAALPEPNPELDGALAKLNDHDVLIVAEGRYRFTVELMRRWVARREMVDGER